MMRAAHLLIALLLAAFSWAAVEAALLLRSLRRTAEALPQMADQHLAALRQDADARIAEALLRADRRLASIERRADRRIADAVERADVRLGEALGEVRALRAQAAPVLAEAQGLLADVRQTQASFIRRIDYWTDCEQNGLCWQGVLTDTMLDARRAARSVAQAAPQTAAAVEASARSMAMTAEASAQTAGNLARLTQPGPRWLRWVGVGLGLAAPAAQVALPFAVGGAK